MNYIEITAAVPTAEAEHASEILRAHTGLDVSIVVPFTQADLESDAVLSTGGASLVRRARQSMGVMRSLRKPR